MAIKTLNEDQYNALKPIKWVWDSLRSNGSVSGLQHSEKELMNSIHFELLGTKSNLSCSSCVIELITFIFIQLDKYEQRTKA